MGLKASKYEDKKIECCNNCNAILKGSKLYCLEHGCHVDWNGICDEYEWRRE